MGKANVGREEGWHLRGGWAPAASCRAPAFLPAGKAKCPRGSRGLCPRLGWGRWAGSREMAASSNSAVAQGAGLLCFVVLGKKK
jgi:hypothetical protein